MASGADWSIVYYLEDSGRNPVGEFLSSLDRDAVARCLAAIDRLQVENVRAREPLVKKIEGDIWELRRESRGSIYRIFYFFFTGRKIVLLHAFQKKTQRTPRREIDLAKRRRDHYVGREGGDK